MESVSPHTDVQRLVERIGVADLQYFEFGSNHRYVGQSAEAPEEMPAPAPAEAPEPLIREIASVTLETGPSPIDGEGEVPFVLRLEDEPVAEAPAAPMAAIETADAVPAPAPSMATVATADTAPDAAPQGDSILAVLRRLSLVAVPPQPASAATTAEGPAPDTARDATPDAAQELHEVLRGFGENRYAGSRRVA